MKKKKITLLSILLSVALLLVGCSNIKENKFKTEYLKDENAKIDHYEIVYKGYISENDKLYVNFLITNNSKNEQEINSNQNFVLYTNESKKLENSFKEEKIKIKSNETKNIRITIQAPELFNNNKLIDITSYKIIFYSGVVTNNIGFVI